MATKQPPRTSSTPHRKGSHREDERVFEADTPFGSGWNGVLVIQDLEDYEAAAIDEQHVIRILQASELETALPVVLDRVLADDLTGQSTIGDW